MPSSGTKPSLKSSSVLPSVKTSSGRAKSAGRSGGSGGSGGHKPPVPLPTTVCCCEPRRVTTRAHRRTLKAVTEPAVSVSVELRWGYYAQLLHGDMTSRSKTCVTDDQCLSTTPNTIPTTGCEIGLVSANRPLPDRSAERRRSACVGSSRPAPLSRHRRASIPEGSMHGQFRQINMQA